MRLRIASIALVVCFFLAAPAVAGPLGAPCVSTTLDLYQNLGATGCSIGPLNFRDFSFLVSGLSPGYSPLGPTDITVTPVLGPGGPSLTISSGGFLVTGDEYVTYVLSYIIDPPPVIIRGFEDEMESETPVAPGFARVTTDLCVGGVYSPWPSWLCSSGNTDQVIVYHMGSSGNQLSDSTLFAPLVNMLGVRNTIELSGGFTGSADFGALRNNIEAVPEPAAWILLGGGLAALALRRRRRAA